MYLYIFVCVCVCIYVCIYVYKSVKLVTIVEGNLKAPFSLASTPMCRGGINSLPRMYIYIYACMYVCLCVYMYVCMYVFIYIYIYICIYICVCVCVCTYMYVCFYVGIKVLFSLKGELLEPFEVGIGMKQGCLFAPHCSQFFFQWSRLMPLLIPPQEYGYRVEWGQAWSVMEFV